LAATLLVVDVQRCFINQYTHHIPERVAALALGGEYETILFTRFVNVENSPYRRFLDWHECASNVDTAIVSELASLAQPELVFSKSGLAGMPEELARYLGNNHIEQVAIVGIDTDMCVLKIALDAFDQGIEPFILTDCCASTAGLQAHLAGLAVLSRNIGPKQLGDAGLSGGYLAAP
jgi:nicotinamidase-related amidase